MVDKHVEIIVPQNPSQEIDCYDVAVILDSSSSPLEPLSRVLDCLTFGSRNLTIWVPYMFLLQLIQATSRICVTFYTCSAALALTVQF
jgi:hypothetical protein